MINKTRKFKHLSFNDRRIISYMRFSENKTLQEINRNKTKNKYIPEISHQKYKTILHKKDSYKIDNNPAIYDYIIEKFR